MKPVVTIVLSSIGLLVAPAAHAQGSLYLSNLGETSGGYLPVASNAWMAKDFSTGGASGGYIVNSVQLLMAEASGTPSDFSVMLYSSLSGRPGSSLGSLSGPDPASGGVFTYTTPGILLSPAQIYFIVVTASSPMAQGAFQWSYADTFHFSASAGWRSVPSSNSSNDGSNWTAVGFPFQFAVYATAVPEPATSALVSLGLICLVLWRRKARNGNRFS